MQKQARPAARQEPVGIHDRGATPAAATAARFPDASELFSAPGPEPVARARPALDAPDGFRENTMLWFLVGEEMSIAHERQRGARRRRRWRLPMLGIILAAVGLIAGWL